MKIVIVGFTSTGKSVTGKLLAQKLNWQYTDLDDKIEELYFQKTGKQLSCRSIFSEIGREAFTEFEGESIKSTLKKNNLVLSTGGGAPLNPINRETLKKMGSIVYLMATPEVIFERMQKKGFPIFLGKNPSIEDVEKLWKKRDKIYRDIADIKIETSQISVEEVCNKIIENLELSLSKQPHS